MDGDWKSGDYAAHYNRLYATPAEEFAACIDLLELGPEDSLVDFGCGNGEFLLLASARVRTALGVDISGPQAEQARARVAGRCGAEVILSSFLDFDPAGRTFTKGFSRKALHHLDADQKALFFRNIGCSFRKGALFLLEDGIFDFERSDLEKRWDTLMRDCALYYGDGWASKKDDVSFCFRAEFPAGIKEWTSAFGAGGFKVLRRERKSSFYGSLLAVKQ